MDGEVQSGGRSSKEERQARRRKAALARRRRRRLAYGGIVAALLAGPLLWMVDRSGPHAVVEAEVVRTRLWHHRPPDGRPHTHSDATLLIQGLNEVLVRRADTLEKGQRVPVLVRPGRLTAWPYFVELAQEEPPAPPTREEPTLEEPALIDPQQGLELAPAPELEPDIESDEEPGGP
jgi:hypothetical protein